MAGKLTNTQRDLLRVAKKNGVLYWTDIKKYYSSIVYAKVVIERLCIMKYLKPVEDGNYYVYNGCMELEGLESFVEIKNK